MFSPAYQGPAAAVNVPGSESSRWYRPRRPNLARHRPGPRPEAASVTPMIMGYVSGPEAPKAVKLCSAADMIQHRNVNQHPAGKRLL